MTRTPIAVTYGGVEVTYVETENRWRFELYGKEKHSESLTKAKAAIDAPALKDRKKVEAVPVIYKVSYGSPEFSKVTSEVGDGRSFWVTRPDGRRGKEGKYCLYADTPENRAICAEGASLEKQKEELSAQIDACYKRLAKFEGMPQ